MPREIAKEPGGDLVDFVVTVEQRANDSTPRPRRRGESCAACRGRCSLDSRSEPRSSVAYVREHVTLAKIIWWVGAGAAARQ
jgi:hypothetical protein